MEIQEELEPLISFTVIAKEDEEWGLDVIAQLLERLDEVSEDQEDAFWVAVTIDRSEDKYNVALNNEERFLEHVNKALGQELRVWRAEAVYRQDSDMGGLVGVLILMNTVSLQDIMSLGA